MPYLPGKLPYRGWITDCPYTNVPDGYSVDMLNILPADPFRRRVRLGTRPAINRIYKFAGGAQIQCLTRCISYNGDPPVRKDRIFIIAGGKAYYMDANSAAPTQITKVNGSTGVTAAQLNTTGRVSAVQRGQYLYLLDTTYFGTAPNTRSAYWKIDLLDAGLNLSNWSHSSNGPEDHVVKQIGSNYYFAQTIQRYGARIMLAGVKGIENVWFGSEVDEPNHWNPSASPTTGQAIAGNVADSTIGPAGDEIVAIIPLGEQSLLFAGKRSLTYLTNDPSIDPSTARLAVLSNTIGIVGPKAWCEGPEKSVYMLGQDGLYRLRPNDFSVDRANLVSLNKLDSWFNQLRFDLLDPVLHYDVERRGVWIFLTRNDGPSNSTHLFYSEQTDGFFPIKLYDPEMPGVTNACQAPTADGRNQIMLCAYGSMLGFFDQRLVSGADGFPGSGYTDPSAAGPTTESQIRDQMIRARLSIGPMIATQPHLVMVKEIQVELGIDDYLETSVLEGLADRPYVELHCAETAMESIAEDTSTVLFQETTETIDGNASGSTIDGNAGSAAYDCQYSLRAAGTYASQDSFVSLVDRKYYSDGNYYVLERIGLETVQDENLVIGNWYEIATAGTTTWTSIGAASNASGTKFQATGVGSGTGTAKTLRWVIRFVDPTTANGTSTRVVLFAQNAGLSGIVSDDVEVGTYNMLTNNTWSASATVTGTADISDFGAADVTNLGTLREGINNRMRVRKRTGGAYVKILTLGYPFAIERVAAYVDPSSARREVVAESNDTFWRPV